MTIKDEEIIALALEKGERVVRSFKSMNEVFYVYEFSKPELLAFARAIADIQKENDAKICDKKWEGWIAAAAEKPRSESWPDGYTPYDCAKSIRLS